MHYGKTHQLIVKEVENKIVCYKETVECQNLIFLPGSQGRAQCHTAKIRDLNQRVKIDHVPLLSAPYKSIFLRMFLACLMVIQLVKKLIGKSKHKMQSKLLCVDIRPPLDPLLSQFNAIYIIPFMLASQKQSLSLEVP
jgi:hypothetical protein